MAQIDLSNPSTSFISSENQEYELQVKLQIQEKDQTTYYLRGVFFKQGSSDYCGYTWNGNSWFKGPYSSGDGWKNFLPVTIASGAAESNLKAKVDIEDKDCLSGGEYRFKVQRFTVSGSSNFDTQNDQSLTIAVSAPTLVPTVIPSLKLPTHTKIPPPLNPTTVSIPPSVIITSKIPTGISNSNENKDLLSTASSSAHKESDLFVPSITKLQSQVQGVQTLSSIPLIAGLFFIGGGCFIASAIYLGLRQRKKLKEGVT